MPWLIDKKDYYTIYVYPCQQDAHNLHQLSIIYNINTTPNHHTRLIFGLNTEKVFSISKNHRPILGK